MWSGWSRKEEEREQLQSLVDEGRGNQERAAAGSRVVKADQSEDAAAWPDEWGAEFAEVSLSTVHRVRLRFVAEGCEAVLLRKPVTERSYRNWMGRVRLG